MANPGRSYRAVTSGLSDVASRLVREGLSREDDASEGCVDRGDRGVGQGHASSAFTLSTQTHSQPDALAAAAQSLARVVTIHDNSGGR